MEVIIFLYQENILINYSLREILSNHKNWLFEIVFTKLIEGNTCKVSNPIAINFRAWIEKSWSWHQIFVQIEVHLPFLPRFDLTCARPENLCCFSPSPVVLLLHFFFLLCSQLSFCAISHHMLLQYLWLSFTSLSNGYRAFSLMILTMRGPHHRIFRGYLSFLVVVKGFLSQVAPRMRLSSHSYSVMDLLPSPSERLTRYGCFLTVCSWITCKPYKSFRK